MSLNSLRVQDLRLKRKFNLVIKVKSECQYICGFRVGFKSKTLKSLLRDLSSGIVFMGGVHPDGGIRR